MTVSIANLRSTWANSDITYTGLGLNVNASAYSSNSSIVRFSLNSEDKFKLYSNGDIHLFGNIISSTILFNDVATNTFLLSVIAGANVEIGTGANSWSNTIVLEANNYLYDVANASFMKANEAYEIAVAGGGNTGEAIVSTNNFLQSIVLSSSISANAFAADTISGANTAVGAGANAYADLSILSVNSFITSTIAGANTAVGTGANAFATVAAAGANAYMIAVQNGSNTAVGTGANVFATAAAAGANAYMISVQNGSNTAIGAGANAYMISVQNGSNTAIGAGSNAFTTATIAGANTDVGTGANTVGSAAFNKANSANYFVYLVNSNTISAFNQANDALNLSISVYNFANSINGSDVFADVSNAYNKANDANVIAVAAFEKANSITVSNTTTGNGNVIYTQLQYLNLESNVVTSVSFGTYDSLNVETIVINTSKTPSTSNSSGTRGEITWDQNYLYICFDTNRWKRVAISNTGW